MLHYVASQIGQTETDGGSLSAAVRDYIQASGVSIDGVSDWGAALMAWAAVKSSIVPPVGSSNPLAWLGWGSALASPLPGCVVILTDGGGKSRFLCGVAANVQGRKVYVVGAFDRTVQTRAFPIEQVVAARRPPPSDGAAQSVAITIEHEPQPVVTYQQPAVPMISPPPMPAEIQAPAQIADDPAAVQVQHLEAMLELMKNEVNRIDARIDHVQQNAIADVQIKEVS